jgi:putative ABC transport system substrate-binding protein
MTQSGHEEAAFAAMHTLDLLYCHDLGFGVSAMKRREFILAVGGAAIGWPLVARAQQRARRVGVLIGTGNDLRGQFWLAALRRRLQELGWSDERDLQIDVRWGSADIDYIRSSAVDLVNSKPDVILVYGVRSLNAMREATHQIPVVFIATSDPVGLGLVESLAHPGGNLTGFMLYEVSLAGKLVELIKDLVPDLVRVALVFNPDNTSAAGYWRSIETVATSRNVIPISLPVRDIGNILDAVDAFAREPNGGLVLPTDLTTIVNRDLIVALAARRRLPALYSFRSDVARGGLMSYGPDTTNLFVRAASYIDRILKGEKAADLPVQAPTKLELAINLKTANALGLEVPPSLLARADEVIE